MQQPRVAVVGGGLAGCECALHLARHGIAVTLMEQKPLRYSPAHVMPKLADGTLGWPSEAPYDRIIVTAGAPNIPSPLLKQLADPGIMLIPVGSNRREQKFVKVVKAQQQISAKTMGKVAFVDLIGDYGWQDEQPAAARP